MPNIASNNSTKNYLQIYSKNEKVVNLPKSFLKNEQKNKKKKKKLTSFRVPPKRSQRLLPTWLQFIDDIHHRRERLRDLRDAAGPSFEAVRTLGFVRPPETGANVVVFLVLFWCFPGVFLVLCSQSPLLFGFNPVLSVGFFLVGISLR